MITAWVCIVIVFALWLAYDLGRTAEYRRVNRILQEGEPK